MKAILLASLMTLICFAAITAVLRVWRTERRAVTMLRIWLATVPVLVALQLLTPSDLGFLPAALSDDSALVELWFGVFVYGAAFFGGILQIYNLADRGLSLRVLIDLTEATRPMTPEELATAYSAGQGIRWMYTKRLADLVDRNLVLIEEGRVSLTITGRWAAAVLEPLRLLLRVE